MSDILKRILDLKRQDVDLRQAERPLSSFQEGITPSDRDFFAFLSRSGLSLIAEIKPKSPSKGILRDPCDPIAVAQVYDRYASAISVLCDEPFFGGRHENLSLVRPVTHVPLLCKDFIYTEYQIWEARSYGADAVLLMASVLSVAEIEKLLELARSLGMEALVEVHDEVELDGVLTTSTCIIGVNNRNLKTLEIDPENAHRLASRIRASGCLLVAESGIESPDALAATATFADAVLIGTAFMREPDIEAAIRGLGFLPTGLQFKGHSTI